MCSCVCIYFHVFNLWAINTGNVLLALCLYSFKKYYNKNKLILATSWWIHLKMYDKMYTMKIPKTKCLDIISKFLQWECIIALTINEPLYKLVSTKQNSCKANLVLNAKAKVFWVLRSITSLLIVPLLSLFKL